MTESVLPGWTQTINRPINSRELCQLSYRGPLHASLPRDGETLAYRVPCAPKRRRAAAPRSPTVRQDGTACAVRAADSALGHQEHRDRVCGRTGDGLRVGHQTGQERYEQIVGTARAVAGHPATSR